MAAVEGAVFLTPTAAGPDAPFTTADAAAADDADAADDVDPVVPVVRAGLAFFFGVTTRFSASESSSDPESPAPYGTKGAPAAAVAGAGDAAAEVLPAAAAGVGEGGGGRPSTADLLAGRCRFTTIVGDVTVKEIRDLTNMR